MRQKFFPSIVLTSFSFYQFFLKFGAQEGSNWQ